MVSLGVLDIQAASLMTDASLCAFDVQAVSPTDGGFKSVSPAEVGFPKIYVLSFAGLSIVRDISLHRGGLPRNIEV